MLDLLDWPEKIYLEAILSKSELPQHKKIILSTPIYPSGMDSVTTSGSVFRRI